MTLREALEKKKISIRQLAHTYGCSTAYLYDLMKRKNAGKKTLIALSVAIGEIITGV